VPVPKNYKANSEVGVSEAEDPALKGREVTIEDVRRLMGASTPHFALQLRARIAALIRGLPADDPARLEGEREIERLESLGFTGEVRGGRDDERPMPTLSL